MCLMIVVEDENVARKLSRLFPNAEVQMRYRKPEHRLLDRWKRGEFPLDDVKHMRGFQGQVNGWGTMREKLALSEAIDYYKFDPWTGEAKFT